MDHKSKFRIFICLMYSCAIGSFLGTLMSAFIFKPAWLVLSPFSVFFGPFCASPALLFMGFPYCVYLDRKKKTDKLYFLIGGIFLAGFYWVLLLIYMDSFQSFFGLIVFIFSGLFTGIIYWREVYSGITGWRIM